MKRHITCIFFIMHFCMFPAARHLDLQRALDQKLVKAIVKSLGGHQGFCIQMSLTNLGKDSLVIEVEAGRRLNSVDDGEQDILVTRESFIALKGHENKSFKVNGYCCQASKRSPAKGSKYAVYAMADEKLVKLAKLLNRTNPDPGEAQTAIWAISDNWHASMIVSQRDTSSLVLRKFVCETKGDSLPWYSVFSKTYVYPNGVMKTWPLWLRGQLVYDCGETSYTTLHVLDEKGMEVCQIVQQWSYPGRSQVYKLNIPVRGLAKGKYLIELRSDKMVLDKRQFEI